MAASDMIELAERTMFQPFLQHIAIVLEVPKIGFKVRLPFFLTKILMSGIDHVYVKLQVRLYKTYHESFFIVRIKTNIFFTA